RKDRFCGNILLYDYLSSKRAPVVLNRSLSRAFQVHQHLLLGGNTENLVGPDFSLRVRWRPPSWDELDDMIETDTANGSFFLNIESIRVHGKQRSAQDGDQTPHARKSRVLLRAKSSIKASFFPESSQVCRTRSTLNAVLKANDRGSEGSASVDIEPFVIKRQNLVPTSSRVTSGTSYLMELRLTFTSKDEAEDFYDYMGVKNIAGNPLQLVSIYENILHCPSGPTMLQMKDHTNQLVFDLEVCMWWANTVPESILVRSNRTLRSREKRTRPYLTPPLDVDRQPKFQIKYVLGNIIVQKSGLACPLDGCRTSKMTDIKDLRMHLESLHDHFRCTALQEEVDEQGVEHWKFEIEVADHRAEKRTSDRADEPMDVHVHAPGHPFDRDLHLQGITAFHQVATQKHPPKHFALKGRQTTSTTKTIRKRAEAVQARPARPKRAYIVPEAPPGITFFRSVTKQPLHAGDEISESDEEVDLGWMQLRRDAEISKEGITEVAKRFQKAFDGFMQDENLQADIHASDAVVRFTREMNSWLSEDVFGELSSKLDELLQDDIITKDTHTACLEIVRTPQFEGQAADEAQHRFESTEMGLHPILKTNSGRKGRGKAKVTNTGHLTPITTDSDGDLEMRETVLNSDSRMQPPGLYSTTQPTYDECYCGEDPLVSFNASPVIACNRLVSFCTRRIAYRSRINQVKACIRRHFHIECVERYMRRPLPPPKLDMR
ncbi:hypothetical protein IAQ61_008093, partial [Plenodomus lingam]|uniref:uncharacterized protein n=1 Tax=Leptosphaeria maculans TaxID=5022 RepID=UPI0033267923